MRLMRQCFVVTSTLLLASATAYAAPDAAQQALAIQLFDDAEKLMGEKPSEACPKFAESQRLDPQLGTLLHLGACYEKVGKTASAWSSFKDAADIAARRRDEREAIARQYIANLESRLSRLTIEVVAEAPTSIEVKKDGEPFGKAAWGSALPVDPGPHVITAHASGYKDWQTTIDVPAGASAVRASVPKLEPVEAQWTPNSGNSGASAYSTSAQPKPLTERNQPQSNAQRTAGYIVGGVGVAGLAVGAVSALTLNSNSSERDRANACSATHSCTLADQTRVSQLTSDMKGNALWAEIGFIGGGAAVITGAILILTAPSASPVAARAKAFNVQPWVGKSSTGIAIGGVW